MTRNRATSDLSPFGLKVIDELDRQGRSRPWLQAQLGVSRSTLYRLLHGKTDLSLADVINVARALGVEPAAIAPQELVGGARWAGSYHVVEETESPSTGIPNGRAVREQLILDVDEIVRMLSASHGAGTMGPAGILAVLNGMEDAARLEGRTLPASYWRLRRRMHDEMALDRSGS